MKDRPRERLDRFCSRQPRKVGVGVLATVAGECKSEREREIEREAREGGWRKGKEKSSVRALVHFVVAVVLLWVPTCSNHKYSSIWRKIRLLFFVSALSKKLGIFISLSDEEESNLSFESLTCLKLKYRVTLLGENCAETDTYKVLVLCLISPIKTNFWQDFIQDVPHSLCLCPALDNAAPCRR